MRHAMESLIKSQRVLKREGSEVIESGLSCRGSLRPTRAALDKREEVSRR